MDQRSNDTKTKLTQIDNMPLQNTDWSYTGITNIVFSYMENSIGIKEKGWQQSLHFRTVCLNASLEERQNFLWPSTHISDGAVVPTVWSPNWSAVNWNLNKYVV